MPTPDLINTDLSKIWLKLEEILLALGGGATDEYGYSTISVVALPLDTTTPLGFQFPDLGFKYIARLEAIQVTIQAGATPGNRRVIIQAGYPTVPLQLFTYASHTSLQPKNTTRRYNFIRATQIDSLQLAVIGANTFVLGTLTDSEIFVDPALTRPSITLYAQISDAGDSWSSPAEYPAQILFTWKKVS